MPLDEREDNTEHGVPVGGWPLAHDMTLVEFVRLYRRHFSPSSATGKQASYYGMICHIENTHDRPYGGQSLTYCGRLFETGTYYFLRYWQSKYRTCKGCHSRAMKVVPEYRSFVESGKPEQLPLQVGWPDSQPFK